MRVLVTGGTSHLGRRLVRRLHECGHDVIIYTRGGTEANILEGGGFTVVRGDMNQGWRLLHALEGGDALAACTHIRFAGTCIGACRTAGVARFLQVSSTRGQSRFSHHAGVEEVRRGEELIRRCGLDATIIRPTMMFGGRGDGNLDGLVRWFTRHIWFPMPGGGGNLVQPVYVEDVAKAIVQALERPGVTTRHVYTLAGPDSISWRQMLVETARAAGRSRPLFVSLPLTPLIFAARLLPPFLPRRRLIVEALERLAEDRTADIEPARRELNFDPLTLADALQLEYGSTIAE